MSVAPDPVVTPEGIDLRALRKELGLSQAELARTLGFSVRAVQSVEQGWRRPGDGLEKTALLLLMSHRQNGAPLQPHCWEIVHCPPERREQCLTYRAQQGHLCWFLTGTLCTRSARSWEQKRRVCMECPVFLTRLGGFPDEPSAPHA